MLKHIVSK